MENLNINNLPSLRFDATVVTIGNFDGVHAGHQELITRTVFDAQNRNMKSIVVTFNPHPAAYFQPENTPIAICSEACKRKLISSLKVDALLTLSFNRQLASLTPEEYVKYIILDKLNAKVVWIGYDFNFGKNRSGNARILIELAEKFGFQANILEPQRMGDTVVSSTKIREYLLMGKVEAASRLLRRIHLVHGIVVGGDAYGRKMGFPTINLQVDKGLIPGKGIYSGIARVDSSLYAAAIYVGYRPTYEGKELRIEAHLLNFSGDLYGKSVALAFLKYHRDEYKFDNMGQLKVMIKLDCNVAQNDFDLYQQNKKAIPIIW